MKTKLKCPFCHKRLQNDDLLCSCINEDCEESFDMVGTELLWQKVIDLKQDLEHTRKALGYAIDVIKTVAKMSDKLSREYGETLVEQLDNIQAYCWQEGYVLTHEQDLERAITALEQKDVK